jgi:hypothetical protein
MPKSYRELQIHCLINALTGEVRFIYPVCGLTVHGSAGFHKMRL